MNSNIETKYCSEEFGKILKMINSNYNGEKIMLPDFQRNRVWKLKEKQEFRNSLINNFPFGSILLHNKNNENTSLLIDGYQRISTMIEFYFKPFLFLKWVDLQVSDSEGISFLQGDKKIWKKFKESFIKNIKNENIELDITDFIKQNITKLANDNIKTEVINHFVVSIKEKMQKKIDELINFSKKILDVQLPIVKVTTLKNHDLIADIFTNINTSGIKLTKFEIAASRWKNVNINIKYIKNDELFSLILNKIKEKYSYFNDNKNNMPIEISREFKLELEKGEKIDLFELCFGFSKILEEQSYMLFDSTIRKKIDIFEPGFTILNYCMNKTNKDFDKFAENFSDLFKIEENDYAIVKILNMFRYILDIVKNINLYFELPSNKVLLGSANNKNIFWGESKTKTANTIKPSKNQSVSFIIELFNDLYEDFRDYEIYQNLNKRIIEKITKEFHFLKYLLFDTLSNKFESSVNKINDEFIFNKTFRYNRNIEEKQMLKALKDKIIDYNTDSSNDKRKSLTDKGMRMIISVAYKEILNSNINSSVCNYNIDHIYPINLNKKLIESEKLKINSIGNIQLIPENINKIKKDKNLFDFIDSEDFESNKIEKWTFLNKENFYLFNINDKENLIANYEKMILLREEEIIKKVIRYMYSN
ncbi:hypothetical protein mflW37_3310 [Mesoplasma florum W37]|uniref:GmrSD restriction endonucleases N-terminal domain-containing protein n=1 Tax=Mesoplasma florum TaxID=2151 RepID=A0AAD0MN75_MESFO|nr:DUF262 domain-containing protein [Mesoplasma florum]AGY41398.1 hypothetical protein mflW37_3310 [Mesoplasma florum W37]AVN59618.1 DUF262 domain-containing protein [Mesoplasma florum]AVN65738.1 hypothetical protein MflW12_3330 [Mesoplasma florum]